MYVLTNEFLNIFFILNKNLKQYKWKFNKHTDTIK